ncbi:LysR substrate-binding domain-containing protein [Pseudorhizobium flavum]|uniref:LysR substrate-binding domain-containing protein n=1 Tax=Pseudorhizobium flavum TaxID=1335061 RepID=A0A7X0DF96_9HYPH|nr:hypothetical protein [Pseudorhizobium flavum]
MGVALPVGHRLASKYEIVLQDLRGEKFMVYQRREGPGLSDNVLAECRKAGFVPEFLQQTPQLSTTINLAASRIGYRSRKHEPGSQSEGPFLAHKGSRHRGRTRAVLAAEPRQGSRGKVCQYRISSIQVNSNRCYWGPLGISAIIPAKGKRSCLD